MFPCHINILVSFKKYSQSFCHLAYKQPGLGSWLHKQVFHPIYSPMKLSHDLITTKKLAVCDQDTWTLIYGDGANIQRLYKVLILLKLLIYPITGNKKYMLQL